MSVSERPRWACLLLAVLALTAANVGHGGHGASSCRWREFSNNTAGNFTWYTSPQVRSDAVVGPGDRSRLRAALDRYKSGKGLTITVSGGSISASSGIVDGLSFPGWLKTAVSAFLGDEGITFKVAAIPGVSSALISLCHDLHIPLESDIIILEYTTNDLDPMMSAMAYNRPFHIMDNMVRRPYERLLRKLLLYPRRPAVVMLHSYSWAKMLPFVGCYWSTYESEYHEFALFYGLPEVSVRSAAYHLMAQGVEGYQVHRFRASEKPGQLLNDDDEAIKGKVFYFDTWHPDGNTGARVMGEITAQLILDAWEDVRARPLNSHERWVAEQQALVEPMLPSNHESMTGNCIVGPHFGPALVERDGFHWVGTEKDQFFTWGFESEAPGSRLLVRLNTTSEAATPESRGSSVVVEVWYAVHGVFGGQANISCVAGCTCKRTTINTFLKTGEDNAAYIDAQWGAQRLAMMQVSQADNCDILVQVLDTSTSIPSSNRVKIGGFLVAEDPSDIPIQNYAAIGWLSKLIEPPQGMASGPFRTFAPVPGTGPKLPGPGEGWLPGQETLAGTPAPGPLASSSPDAGASSAAGPDRSAADYDEEAAREANSAAHQGKVPDGSGSAADYDEETAKQTNREAHAGNPQGGAADAANAAATGVVSPELAAEAAEAEKLIQDAELPLADYTH